MWKAWGKYKITVRQGCLVSSVGGACDSWPQGHEFKPHVGCRTHLKKKKKSLKKRKKSPLGRYDSNDCRRENPLIYAKNQWIKMLGNIEYYHSLKEVCPKYQSSMKEK